MAKQRVWSSLSSAYRTRLLRSGITQKQYEGGASLTAARGHAETPERPSEAIRQPSKYQKYRAKAKGLAKQIEERKWQLWEDRFKYHDIRQREYVQGKQQGVKAPGIMLMLATLAMDDDEWEERVHIAAIHERDGIDDDWKFLFYH